jgi:hypothetical protein
MEMEKHFCPLHNTIQGGRMSKEKRIDENTILNIFRDLMAGKLAANRNKPIHWSSLSISELLSLMAEEITELQNCIINGENAIAVLHEAADVANYAMFIAALYQRNHELLAKAAIGINHTEGGKNDTK